MVPTGFCASVRGAVSSAVVVRKPSQTLQGVTINFTPAGKSTYMLRCERRVPCMQSKKIHRGHGKRGGGDPNSLQYMISVQDAGVQSKPRPWLCYSSWRARLNQLSVVSQNSRVLFQSNASPFITGHA